MFNELFNKILEKNPELKEEKSIKRDIASGSIYLDMSKIDDITIPDGYIYDEVTNQITVKDSGDLVALVKDINKKSIFSRFFTKKEKTKKEEKEENKGLISKIKGLFSKKTKKEEKEEKEENKKGLFSRIFGRSKTNSEDLLDDPTDPDHKVKKSDIFGSSKDEKKELVDKINSIIESLKEKIDDLYSNYKSLSLKELEDKLSEINILIENCNRLAAELNRIAKTSYSNYKNKKYDEIMNYYKEKVDSEKKSELETLKSEIDGKINDLKEKYESLSVDDLCRNIGQIEFKISEYNKKSKNKYENEDYEKIVKYAYDLSKKTAPVASKTSVSKTSDEPNAANIFNNKIAIVNQFRKIDKSVVEELDRKMKSKLGMSSSDVLKVRNVMLTKEEKDECKKKAIAKINFDEKFKTKSALFIKTYAENRTKMHSYITIFNEEYKKLSLLNRFEKLKSLIDAYDKETLALAAKVSEKEDEVNRLRNYGFSDERLEKELEEAENNESNALYKWVEASYPSKEYENVKNDYYEAKKRYGILKSIDEKVKEYKKLNEEHLKANSKYQKAIREYAELEKVVSNLNKCEIIENINKYSDKIIELGYKSKNYTESKTKKLIRK